MLVYLQRTFHDFKVMFWVSYSLKGKIARYYTILSNFPSELIVQVCLACTIFNSYFNRKRLKLCFFVINGCKLLQS